MLNLLGVVVVKNPIVSPDTRRLVRFTGWDLRERYRGRNIPFDRFVIRD